MIRPKIGVAVLTMSGCNLDEQQSPGYLNELVNLLKQRNMETVSFSEPVNDLDMAEKAAAFFNQNNVDTYILLVGTFIPDSIVIPIATRVNKPMVVWANDRNIFNLSLVGAQNVTPVLWEHGIKYRFVLSDFDNDKAVDEVCAFIYGCALKNKLSNSRIGYWGGHPSIMTEHVIDEVAVRKILGPTLVNYGNEDIILNRKSIPREEIIKEWERTKSCAGCVRASDEDGYINSSIILYLLKKAREEKLDAMSINCWPYLKGQVCVPIARLNDYGIPTACEGDLNSAILMLALYQLSGKASSFGDQMKVLNRDTAQNSLVFSHCGAGAFSLASSKESIVIHEDYETGKGLGVYFPENIQGTVTICNLTGLGTTYRMFITRGKVIDTDMIYEGNPMNVQFDFNVMDMLDEIAHGGFGHHWILAYGDYVDIMKEYCRLIGIRYKAMI